MKVDIKEDDEPIRVIDVRIGNVFVRQNGKRYIRLNANGVIGTDHDFKVVCVDLQDTDVDRFPPNIMVRDLGEAKISLA